MSSQSHLDISSLFSVKGLVVVITGGAIGIGRMIAEGFLANDVALVVITSRTQSVCDTAQAELNERYGANRCVAIPADFSKMDHIEAFKVKIQSITPHVDVLVNNAGTSWGEPIETFPLKGWDRVMDLNLRAPFFLMQAFLPLLSHRATKEKPSRIINIGSTAGVNPQIVPTYSYDVSKAALHYLTRKLAADLSPRHITVNAIAPGYVPSRMSNQLLTYTPAQDIIDSIPLARAGGAGDMAGAALYLSGAAGGWVTGVVLVVDGGAAISTQPAAL